MTKTLLVRSRKADEMEVEYHRWFIQKSDNFTSVLFHLLTKADQVNFYKLAQVYSVEAYVVAKVQGKHYVSWFEIVGEEEPE